MPLYMDIHTVDSDTFTVEDVVKAHMEDIAIQERFGITPTYFTKISPNR